MKTIAFTGLSGVLGRYMMRDASRFFTENKILDLYHTTATNNTDFDQIKLNLLDIDSIIPTLKKHNPDIIIHLAAITHIDVCEKDRAESTKGKVWQLNVEATKKISNYCTSAQKKLLFMSTECVFDGSKNWYLESDVPSPKNWYGTTKAAAEQFITQNNPEAAIIRGVVAYHIADSAQHTILGKLKHSFEGQKPFTAVSDQFFTPTSIPDISTVIEAIIKKDMRGIFHVAPVKKTTPYQFGLQLGKYLDYDTSLINKAELAEFFGAKRASFRLQNACLDSTLTRKKLGMTFRTLLQSLKEKQT